MATHSCILAWRIPWPEEPVGLHAPTAAVNCEPLKGKNSIIYISTSANLEFPDSQVVHFRNCFGCHFVTSYLEKSVLPSSILETEGSTCLKLLTQKTK